MNTRRAVNAISMLLALTICGCALIREPEEVAVLPLHVLADLVDRLVRCACGAA